MSNTFDDQPRSSAANLTAPRAVARQEGKGGKGGNPAPAPAVSNFTFLSALFGLLKGAVALICGKAGDPGSGGWLPHAAAEVDQHCPADVNTYFNCASFHPATDGTLNARKENVSAYHVFVLDDVGTKVPWSTLPDVPSTFHIETSPGNFQVGYNLTTPVTDADLVEAAQRAIFGAGLGDPGAGGMSRWMRMPNGVNGKPKYRDERGQPFRCKLTHWDPEVSYELEDLVGLLVTNTPPLRLEPAVSRAVIPRAHSEHRINPDVFIPAANENPVVTALKERSLYKHELIDGRHEVTCPWVHEHTNELDTGACFFEPSAEFPLGGFKCQHSHGDKYRLGRLLGYLDLDRRSVANRPVLRITQGEIPAMIQAVTYVLTQTERYYQSGGSLVRIDLEPSGYKFSRVREADLQLDLARLIEWERCNDKGQWRRSNPDLQLNRQLLQLTTLPWLPVIDQIAWQPMFDQSGDLLRKGGYDEPSRTYCAFDGDHFILPEPTRENAEAALSRLKAVLNEFRFVTPVDEAATICGIFTATMRPGLGRAPAFHFRAPASGSGKSHLSDTTAKFATPGAVAKVSYPRSDEEATKVVLAALRDKPAVLDFDDMATDWKPFGAINRLLTSPTMTDRILGSSEMATVTTDVLVLGSGNNTAPIGDLQRRVMVINLDTGSETPALIRYDGSPLETVERHRAAFVCDVLTVALAWRAAGEPRADVKPLATYSGRWADYCRHTLIWMGIPDPAQGMITRLQDDPDAAALGRLLRAWHVQHADKPVTIRSLLDDANSELVEALEELPFVEGGAINRSRFGWYCKRNENRPAGGLRLEKAPCSERTAWRVVAVGGGLPPSPALPPSAEPR